MAKARVSRYCYIIGQHNRPAAGTASNSNTAFRTNSEDSNKRSSVAHQAIISGNHVHNYETDLTMRL